jgi:hypothetical protein
VVQLQSQRKLGALACLDEMGSHRMLNVVSSFEFLPEHLLDEKRRVEDHIEENWQMVNIC